MSTQKIKDVMTIITTDAGDLVIYVAANTKEFGIELKDDQLIFTGDETSKNVRKQVFLADEKNGIPDFINVYTNKVTTRNLSFRTVFKLENEKDKAKPMFNKSEYEKK